MDRDGTFDSTEFCGRCLTLSDWLNTGLTCFTQQLICVIFMGVQTSVKTTEGAFKSFKKELLRIKLPNPKVMFSSTLRNLVIVYRLLFKYAEVINPQRLNCAQQSLLAVFN